MMARDLSPMELEALTILREADIDEELTGKLMGLMGFTVDAFVDVTRREIKRQTLENIAQVWLIGVVCGLGIAAMIAAIVRMLP